MELFWKWADHGVYRKAGFVGPGNEYSKLQRRIYHKMAETICDKSGTSMATPVVSGAIACLLSKYPDMTNVEVKLRLRDTCVPREGAEQGWGMLHVGRLLEK